MFKNRNIEAALAVASFVVATAFAFTSLALAESHEPGAGSCAIVAQFLLLTASILGIDYKLNQHGSTTKGNTEQQPPKHKKR